MVLTTYIQELVPDANPLLTEIGSLVSADLQRPQRLLVLFSARLIAGVTGFDPLAALYTEFPAERQSQTKADEHSDNQPHD